MFRFWSYITQLPGHPITLQSSPSLCLRAIPMSHTSMNVKRRGIGGAGWGGGKRCPLSYALWMNCPLKIKHLGQWCWETQRVFSLIWGDRLSERGAGEELQERIVFVCPIPRLVMFLYLFPCFLDFPLFLSPSSLLTPPHPTAVRQFPCWDSPKDRFPQFISNSES